MSGIRHSFLSKLSTLRIKQQNLQEFFKMAQTDEVKKIIRSLLVSAPLKVTVSTLNRDYNELEGFYIPFKDLGYNSLLHFLHSIPDVLRVNGTSPHSEVTLVVSEKIAHVNDLVMKQRKPSKGKKAVIPKKSVINSPTTSLISPSYKIRNKDFENIDYNRNVEKISSLQNQIDKYSIPPSLSPFPRPLSQKYNKISISRIHIPKCELRSNEVEQNNSEVECMLEIQPKSEKLKLIKARLSKEKVIQKHICFDDMNQNNITITFRNNRTDDEIGKVNIGNDEYTKIPVEIQKNLQKLISRYPLGLSCSLLPLEYEKLYRKELHFEKYGFASLIRLCMTLENIFHWEKESTFDFKLYDRSKPIPKIRMCSNDDFSENSSDAHVQEIDPLSIIAIESNDWDEYLESIPANTFKLGKQISNSCVGDFIIGDRVPIVVSAISDPGNFWVYKDNGVLDSMMNSMQNFYRDNKAKYLIPEFLLEIGLYCVVHTLGEFQRGLIVDLLSGVGGHVKVYFIDYGTFDNIVREKVWFLTSEFSVLPAQATQGQLSDIKPVNEIWNKQSTLKFKDFVCAKHVFAKIVGIEERKVIVYIADFKSPLKFLNDVLVQEGYASYKSEVSLQNAPSAPSKKREISKLLNRIKMKRMSTSTQEDKNS